MTRLIIGNIMDFTLLFYLVIIHGYLIPYGNSKSTVKNVKHDIQVTIKERTNRAKHTNTFSKKSVQRPLFFKKSERKNNKDENAEKRGFGSNVVTIPEPFPVNKFVQEPFLEHHVRYVPQPYPVKHLEYVPQPIAVPVEVPNQVKVQHFHIHKDRE